MQFVDGDCEMYKRLDFTAYEFLLANPKTISVCGNRMERYPEATLYNKLINMEWQGAEGK